MDQARSQAGKVLENAVGKWGWVLGVEGRVNIKVKLRLGDG